MRGYRLSRKSQAEKPFKTQTVVCLLESNITVHNIIIIYKTFYLNPIGFAPISGMWIKVFVKALPNTVTSLINTCLAMVLYAKL